jgi:hypothetical protein
MLIGELWAAAETETRGDLWWWRNSSARWVRRREAFLVGAAAAGVSKLSNSPPVLAANLNAG